MLPFSKSEQNQILFHPVDSFTFFPLRLLAMLFLRTDEVYVPARGARRGLSRANLGWV